jgi:hypothetical protein
MVEAVQQAFQRLCAPQLRVQHAIICRQTCAQTHTQLDVNSKVEGPATGMLQVEL